MPTSLLERLRADHLERLRADVLLGRGAEGWATAHPAPDRSPGPGARRLAGGQDVTEMWAHLAAPFPSHTSQPRDRDVRILQIARSGLANDTYQLVSFGVFPGERRMSGRRPAQIGRAHV